MVPTGGKDNDLWKAITHWGFNLTEIKVVLVVMRHTLGWRKEWDWISYSQFAEETGKSRTSVYNAIVSLKTKKVLLTNPGRGKTNRMALNQNFDEWNSTANKPVSKENIRRFLKGLVRPTELTSTGHRTRLVRETEPNQYGGPYPLKKLLQDKEKTLSKRLSEDD